MVSSQGYILRYNIVNDPINLISFEFVCITTISRTKWCIRWVIIIILMGEKSVRIIEFISQPFNFWNINFSAKLIKQVIPDINIINKQRHKRVGHVGFSGEIHWI